MATGAPRSVNPSAAQMSYSSNKRIRSATKYYEGVSCTENIHLFLTFVHSLSAALRVFFCLRSPSWHLSYHSPVSHNTEKMCCIMIKWAKKSVSKEQKLIGGNMTPALAQVWHGRCTSANTLPLPLTPARPGWLTWRCFPDHNNAGRVLVIPRALKGAFW